MSSNRQDPAPILEFQTDEGATLIDPSTIVSVSKNHLGGTVINYMLANMGCGKIVTNPHDEVIAKVKAARSAPIVLLPSVEETTVDASSEKTTAEILAFCQKMRKEARERMVRTQNNNRSLSAYWGAQFDAFGVVIGFIQTKED